MNTSTARTTVIGFATGYVVITPWRCFRCFVIMLQVESTSNTMDESRRLYFQYLIALFKCSVLYMSFSFALAFSFHNVSVFPLHNSQHSLSPDCWAPPQQYKSLAF